MKKQIIISVLLSLVFYSCDNSVDNNEKTFYERYILDASSLIIDATIERIKISEDSTSSNVVVNLTDKSDYEKISIKNGIIKINGIELNFSKESLDYKSSSLNINPDTYYEIEIFLSNGERITNSIKTQNKIPIFLSLPETQERNKDLIVKWDLSSIQDRFFLEFWYINSIGPQQISYNLINISDGELIIPSSSFGWLTDSTKTLHLKLVSRNLSYFNNTNSKISSNFYSEEKIINLIP
ncbi:MAG: hypothetical protein CMF23_17315 [Ignavibacteriae bacterium]|nr:hypothetical protein [Ignavibacteriota bacterium]